MEPLYSIGHERDFKKYEDIGIHRRVLNIGMRSSLVTVPDSLIFSYKIFLREDIGAGPALVRQSQQSFGTVTGEDLIPQYNCL